MPSAAYQRLLRGLHRYTPPEVDDHPGPLREALEQTAQLFSIPEDVAFGRDELAGVPVEWVEPPGASGDALLLYVHGGGYHMGGIETYRHFVGRVAKTAGMRTVHVDYRLAPEHPFPAAVDDVDAVTQALAGEHVESERLVMAGDSAGGGLTLATLLRFRDRGSPLPAGAALISPWTDLTCSGASFRANRETDPIIHMQGTDTAVHWYTQGTPADTPLVSPLFADLAGLPPLLVQVGTAEVLLDDSTRLADRARQHGVDVHLDVWEDMVHVWHYYAEWIPEGRKALERIGEFLGSRLANA